jgi:hypothetical protein
MSSILGFLGNLRPSSLAIDIASIHPHPLHHISSSAFYLAAGGVPQTCLCSSSFRFTDEHIRGWLVVGCGISGYSDHCEILSSERWQAILSSSQPRLHDLDGHFIVLQWGGEKLVCSSDLFGLRTLYMSQLGSGVALSTRLD